MRRVVAFVVAGSLLACAGANAAGGSAGRDALVRPGVAIGKLRLGMSLSQVQRVIGRHTLVNVKDELGFKRHYVELDWNYGVWTVGFVGREGDYRVVKIATTTRRERTAKGNAVGSRARRLVAEFPRGVCRTGSDADRRGSRTRLELVHGRGVVTRFYVGLLDPKRWSSSPVVVQEIELAGAGAPQLQRPHPCPLSWLRR